MRGRPLLYQVFPAQPSRRRECKSSSKFPPLLGTSYFASAAALTSANDGVISQLLCILTEACLCRCPARINSDPRTSRLTARGGAVDRRCKGGDRRHAHWLCRYRADRRGGC